uniref:Prostacyclin synthase n=1 Tax=Bionectria ochroleuca TaxID=29856 RepID=A0A0B7KRF5_BIOOC
MATTSIKSLAAMRKIRDISWNALIYTIQQWDPATISLYLCIGTFLIFVYCRSCFGSRLDPREPRAVQPRLPWIGHIIGLIRHRVDYFDILKKKKPMAIATLPILNGKIYAIWSPSLVQSALRNKDLTFDIFGIEFAENVFGLNKETMSIIRGTGSIEESLVSKMMSAIKPTMTGQNLHRMNAEALKYIGSCINNIGGEGLNVPNAYRWLRELMTLATAEAIYGVENPFMKDPTLLNALWEFDANLNTLVLGFLPNIIARAAIRNRNKVQEALMKYYEAGMDQKADVAEITKVRAKVSRESGVKNDEMARLEMALIFVATTNSIPTAYWLLTNIWLRPNIVDRIRAEVAQLAQISNRADNKGRDLTLRISQLEDRCPLLASSYREAVRLGNQVLGTRRVMKDTVLTDADGTSYLLRAGVNVIWSAKLMHRAADVWGDCSDTFIADRFLAGKAGGIDMERKRRVSYLPFGGGKHLCPGRNFAFAEILGFMSALVLGFEVVGLNSSNVRMETGAIGEGVVKPPADGQGGAITIRRRKGWEDVNWLFVC